MRYITRISLGLLTILLFCPSDANAQTGTCSQPLGEDFLDINNVRARILNNGNLFWRGDPHVYEVPQGGGESAIFASGIWVGGQIDGQLRLAGSTYGPYEFWAGPIDDAGDPPSNCDDYDNVWKVSAEDVINYDATGSAPPDLRTWPTGLGAPTRDADGNEIVLQPDGTLAHISADGEIVSTEVLSFAERANRAINLGAGERPAILGDQMLWWIMNDLGNTHQRTGGLPIGLEVHGTAFAFNTSGAIGNTTFYKYKMFYKGERPLENAFMAIFSDPDLGLFDDDYVGSDTLLGLGYVYNSDNDDEGHYGANPPALGYDFFQGPLVDSDGIDNDGDGEIDEEGERLQMTSFVYYNNTGDVTGDPQNAEEYYGYMRARWRDGQRITEGGNGRDFSQIPTNFMFPGDPVTQSYWTELNSDGAGTSIQPADRRFVMSTGPFTIEPGDLQEIVFGIVWSRGSSNLDSVRKLREDDALAQQVFDIDFELPGPPNAPRVTATPLDRSVILTWENLPSDNNYLEQYRAIDPLLSEEVEDNDYVFEGYNVFQYASPQDQEGTLLAVYDLPNGITRVIEGTDLTFVTAEGTDAGVRHHHVVEGLTNYQEYFFGVQAYAFNEESGRKVYSGPVQRLSVIPTKIDARGGGTLISEEAQEMFATRDVSESDLQASKEGGGGGSVSASVVNPAALTGDTYRVDFYEHCTEAGKREAALVSTEKTVDPVTPERSQPAAKISAQEVCVTTYNIVNVTSGETVFDGSTALVPGSGAPQGRNVHVIDGLSFHLEGPAPSFATIPGATNPAFLEVVGPGGADPCEGSTLLGCPQLGGDLVWQSFNSSGEYVTFHVGGGPDESIGAYSPNDFEIRFTEEGSYAYYAFGGFEAIWVPFEVWDIGPTATATSAGTNDPSDDVQMIANLFGDGGGQCEFAFGEAASLFFAEGTIGITDRVYAYYPTTTYEEWESVVEPIVQADPENCPVLDDVDPNAWMLIDFGRGRPLQRIIFDDATGDPAHVHPAFGTVLRFITTKPNLPGDVFTLSTEGLEVAENDAVVAEDALDLIGISPNPYKGASAYEVNQLNDLVRFTNMPQQATVRIFTLSGTLIRTLQKNSPEAFLEWNLTTAEDLPIASGVYLIHVDVPNVGERVLKFSVVKKRPQLNAF